MSFPKVFPFLTDSAPDGNINANRIGSQGA